MPQRGDPFGDAYWDDIAARWDAEIFDTLRHDRQRVILDELIRRAARSRRVADFGCGVGKYLPTLSRLFGEVHGFDQSPVCIRVARERTRSCSNVRLHVAARPAVSLTGAFDVAVCVNAAIHPKRSKWLSVLRSSLRLVRPGGWILLVAPALEAADMMEHIIDDDGTYRVVSSRRGLVTIQGVPTKHFKGAELRDQLTALGVCSCRVRPVEYTWASCGVRRHVPRQVRKPWDWLAVGRRSERALLTT